MTDLDLLGAQFREARDAIGPHRRVQADGELARSAWLKRHRAVPVDVLFSKDTGEPLDPELVALDAAVAAARVDVDWCRAVMLAAGEAFKGEPLEDVLARNAAHRGQQ